MPGYNFTENARRALALSREASVRMHHPYIGTEHILLGLLDLDTGVGVGILQALGVDTNAVRASLDSAVPYGKSGATVGPDLPYTSRGKKAIELALVEARMRKNPDVGSEHLLLGLVREEKGIAAQVLAHHGATLQKTVAELDRISNG